MPDIELTSAEPPMTDELTLAEREWADAQTDATIIIWALKHADRLISLGRAGLEAGKAEESMREPYLVWSNEHRAWWRANGQGYTTSIEHAGIYTRDRALDIARTSRDGWSIHGVPDEIAVAAADIQARARAAIRALPLTGG